MTIGECSYSTVKEEEEVDDCGSVKSPHSIFMEGGSLSIEKMLGDDDYDENDFARQVQL